MGYGQVFYGERTVNCDNRRNVYTLVELVVALGIIAILAGLLLPAVQYSKGSCAKRILPEQFSPIRPCRTSFRSKQWAPSSLLREHSTHTNRDGPNNPFRCKCQCKSFATRQVEGLLLRLVEGQIVELILNMAAEATPVV